MRFIFNVKVNSFGSNLFYLMVKNHQKINFLLIHQKYNKIKLHSFKCLASPKTLSSSLFFELYKCIH